MESKARRLYGGNVSKALAWERRRTEIGSEDRIV
jgi:hypothetical protein